MTHTDALLATLAELSTSEALPPDVARLPELIKAIVESAAIENCIWLFPFLSSK